MAQGNHALINGNVFTADDAQPSATAVAIHNGIIVYVGNDDKAAREAAGQDSEVTDLAGRSATPGLIDAHCHPLPYGDSLANIDLQTGVQSVQDILDRVREAATKTPPGQWLAGWGYYTQTIREGRPPNRRELDSVAPDHPVALTQRSGHEAATNSLGLKLGGYTRDTLDPEGGLIERDEQGELTGVLIENATHALGDAATPDVTPERAEANLRRAVESFLSFGITSVGEAHLTNSDALRLYQKVQSNKSTPRVRFNLMLAHRFALEAIETLGIETGFGSEWLRVGPMKFFLDGTEGQRTARISQPYQDDAGNTGMWMFSTDEFRERIIRAHLAGWQCAVHAIGDAAIELTLDAYRDAQRQLSRPDIRHRIEHASLLRPDLVDRLAHENVIPVPGGRFASNDYPVLIERFGAERVRWYQPWNSLLERNIPVPVSSDAPVQSPDPARNLWAIVNSRSEFDRDHIMQPEERINLEETLLAYTRNGAYASHEEHRKGTLKPGLLGDVTVFNTDLAAVDPLDLDQVRADMTIVAGEVAFRSDGVNGSH
ncbi:MAG: amidohydrolase [Chloroflexia bacterium]|nr:amidohydrolase [Chloroflexia bacterium]